MKIFNIFKNKRDNSPSPTSEWNFIEDILKPFKRKTWHPITEQKKASALASKFSGIPALLKNETWPCCTHCNEPMQLFLQLNAKDLPADKISVFGEGILQVFYCTNGDAMCEVECESFFPFSKSTLVRIVNVSHDNLLSLESSPVKVAFPEKEIVSWSDNDDYPNFEELESLGVTLTEQQYQFLHDQDYPRAKDKLLGWPYWAQDIEYPHCPDCGNTMQFIFQIDSEDNLPYMFGDVGCAHITQCVDHKDKLAIAWACG